MMNQAHIQWMDHINAQYTQHGKNLQAQHMDMAKGTTLPQAGDAYGSEVVTTKIPFNLD